jgi:hypothetical protein
MAFSTRSLPDPERLGERSDFIALLLRDESFSARCPFASNVIPPAGSCAGSITLVFHIRSSANYLESTQGSSRTIQRNTRPSWIASDLLGAPWLSRRTRSTRLSRSYCGISKKRSHWGCRKSSRLSQKNGTEWWQLISYGTLSTTIPASRHAQLIQKENLQMSYIIMTLENCLHHYDLPQKRYESRNEYRPHHAMECDSWDIMMRHGIAVSRQCDRACPGRGNERGRGGSEYQWINDKNVEKA